MKQIIRLPSLDIFNTKYFFSGPRGEIVVGGPLVANGYYNLPEKTAESFYEEDGTKWFRTGDIRK